MSSRFPRNPCVLLLVPAAVCLFAASALGAETPTPEKKNRFADTPCAENYETFCAAKKGWRDSFDCLRARYDEDELSEECAAHTDHVIAKRKNPFLDTPCAEDYETFCAATKGWRLGFNCLRATNDKDELGEECAAHTKHVLEVKRNRVKAREKAWRDACAADIQKNCSQYEKQMAIKGCLYRIRDQVAPLCDEKLPYRPGHTGPGFVGWKDGSEPADHDEKMRQKRRPAGGKALPRPGWQPPSGAQAQDDAAAAAEAERQKIRDAVRARIQANRKAREAAAASASGDSSTADSDPKAEDAPAY